jgi:AP-3 complex subunit beta
VLYNLVALCLDRAAAFVPHIQHFFISSNDSPDIWRLKVELLTLIFPHCDESMKGLILNEFEHFSSSDDEALVRESVRAVGRCANDESASRRCLYLLLNQTSSEDGLLVAEALNVVRKLIQQDPTSHNKTVVRLAKNLDTMINPEARANVIWLVGEFSGVGGADNIAPDVLRILVQSFADESEAAKQQIILLAARVYLQHLNCVSQEASETGDSTGEEKKPEPLPKDDPIAMLWEHVLLLARYDTSYDLRDRARMFKALLADPAGTQLAKLLLLAPKPVPHIPSPSESRKHFMLGSATLVVGEDVGAAGLTGYEPLPDWVPAGEEPDPKLRDELDQVGNVVDTKAMPASRMLDSALKDKEVSRPSSLFVGNK